jgi:hypothetical protein
MTFHGSSSPGNDGWIIGTSQRKDKVGDLTKFGVVNHGKITNFSLARGGLPLSGGAKGWKSDSFLESSEGRKSSKLSTSEAPKPSPPTERKKLNLIPRIKPIVSKSNSEMVLLVQPMSEELTVKKINNMMEEYFSVLDIQVCIVTVYSTVIFQELTKY